MASREIGTGSGESVSPAVDLSNQWRIQNFPEDGAPTLRGGGGQHMIFAKFSA